MTKKNIRLGFLLAAIVAFIALAIPTNAQDEPVKQSKPNLERHFKYQLSLGYTGLILFSDNPGAKPMLERDSTKKQVVGGSFDMAQPGLQFQLLYPIDKAEKWKVPIKFEHYFFHAAEIVPLSRYIRYDLEHKVQITAISLGLNHYFFKAPFANVNFFAGAEIKANMLSDNEYNYFQDHKIDDTRDTSVTLSPKKACQRIGAAFHLGFEGEVESPVYVIANAAVGSMNLIGKDDERGELLTILNYEDKESTVFYWQIVFAIQYRL